MSNYLKLGLLLILDWNNGLRICPRVLLLGYQQRMVDLVVNLTTFIIYRNIHSAQLNMIVCYLFISYESFVNLISQITDTFCNYLSCLGQWHLLICHTVHQHSLCHLSTNELLLFLLDRSVQLRGHFSRAMQSPVI